MKIEVELMDAKNAPLGGDIHLLYHCHMLCYGEGVNH